MVIFFVFLSILIFLYIYLCRTTKQSCNISPASSSPPTSTNAQTQAKFDVFLSFRGEDTRAGFTSHLHAALERKQILTFIDDQLVTGDEMSASLLRTIEEAKLSVVVFSEKYASSKWCLEELAKIFECRKNNGQIVIPVFYQVDPSHVRYQTGSFGDFFKNELVKKRRLTMDKVRSFKDALTDAANLSGWSLGKSELESEFIERIVGDVLSKLHGMSSSHTAGLFGIDVRVNKVESLLDMESQRVLIVGIWGMGGIGKTTIAEAVCNKVRSRFEGIFVANFRQQLKTSSMADLQRSFLSQLLGQEILKMGSLSFRDTFVRDRLRRKKVFIVLDDVDDLMLLKDWEVLLPRLHRPLGPGSKVLLTSRDKQVLTNVVDETYEVERLSYEEALQLFISKALKNCISTTDHRCLIEMIPHHVQGNPLALVVLGSSLYGKSTEEWYSALNKVALNPRIENVLRISYDGLDTEQQSIFLVIAHFFRRFEQEQAIRILDVIYCRRVIYDINTLIDMCLITTSDNKLEIHDLLQEMAFSIVRAESKSPGKRGRLCHLPDVIHAMEENKGTEEIQGIYVDISKLSRQIQLKPNAFAMMDDLRLLKFFSSHFSEDNKDKILLPSTGLYYLSNKLIYFHWEGFPSRSLPQRFCAEHLVELNLRRSKVEKLWTGVQDIGNLRNIVLSHSPYLTELPDLSKAKNLVSLNLSGCSSLTEVPSSLQHLDKLEGLFLRDCYNLRSFPKTTSLKDLTLDGCSKITKFPKISGDIKSLELGETAITEVPSSIQFLKKLSSLHFGGCSKLESLPEITVPMESLTLLDLDNTGIKEIPSSLVKHMISLETLFLSGTRITELPLSIKDMVCLRHLYLDRTPIKTLPELPLSLMSLSALDCESLETTMISTITLGNLSDALNFVNCFNLDQKPLIEAMHLKILSGEKIGHDIIRMVLPGSEIPGEKIEHDIIQMLLKGSTEFLEEKIEHYTIQMVLPGSEIPEWFGYKGIGSSLTMQLPSNCHQLKGIAFCLVFLLPLPYSYNIFNESVWFRIDLDCHVKSKKGDGHHMFQHVLYYDELNFLKIGASDHMFLHYELGFVDHFRKYSGNAVTFKFYNESDGIRMPCMLKSCGLYLHFDENPHADTLFVENIPYKRRKMRER